MTEYTDSPDALAEYVSARTRTSTWVAAHAALPPSTFRRASLAPTLPAASRPPSPVPTEVSSRSLPPRMMLRYDDGRPDEVVHDYLGGADWPAAGPSAPSPRHLHPHAAPPSAAYPPPRPPSAGPSRRTSHRPTLESHPTPEQINILPSRSGSGSVHRISPNNSIHHSAHAPPPSAPGPPPASSAYGLPARSQSRASSHALPMAGAQLPPYPQQITVFPTSSRAGAGGGGSVGSHRLAHASTVPPAHGYAPHPNGPPHHLHPQHQGPVPLAPSATVPPSSARHSTAPSNAEPLPIPYRGPTSARRRYDSAAATPTSSSGRAPPRVVSSRAHSRAGSQPPAVVYAPRAREPDAGPGIDERFVLPDVRHAHAHAHLAANGGGGRSAYARTHARHASTPVPAVDEGAETEPERGRSSMRRSRHSLGSSGVLVERSRSAGARSRGRSDASGSTYYVLPAKGQKVHVLQAPDDDTLYSPGGTTAVTSPTSTQRSRHAKRPSTASAHHPHNAPHAHEAVPARRPLLSRLFGSLSRGARGASVPPRAAGAYEKPAPASARRGRGSENVPVMSGSVGRASGRR